MKRECLTLIAALTLAACQQNAEPPAASEEAVVDTPAESPVTLASVLAGQPDEHQARYAYRNPLETIEFFGIEPGMTVVEGLPGGGWYTKLLLPWLGADGSLIGANYSLEMYPLFSFANDEFMARQNAWLASFPVDAAEWGGDGGASIGAFHFGSMPDEVAGTADVVFMVRALHNLARFESQGGYLTTALAEAYRALKPGGVLGVVQHEARADMPDEFADGSHGYLKKSFVKQAAADAGFEFVAETDINQNPADQPGEDDIVWRLPPSLVTSGENPELRAELEAVGESNRMTLKFRKPE